MAVVQRGGELAALGVVVPGGQLHPVRAVGDRVVPRRAQGGGVAGLVVHALVGPGVLHGDGLHPLLAQRVGEPDVPGHVALTGVGAVAPGREGVAERREPLGVGAEVQEHRDQGGGDAVLPQPREHLCPPGGFLGLGLERADHQAPVGQPVGGRGGGEAGQLVGEGDRVGVQGRHVRHQGDPEAGIDAVRGTQQRVDPFAVGAGQGEDVDGEAVDPGVPGGAHLPFQIGQSPVPAGGGHGQRPVPQQPTVGRVPALLAPGGEVVAGVVVAVGGLVVEGERIRREVVREDQVRARAQHAGGGQVERQRGGARRRLAAPGVLPVQGQPGAGDQSHQQQAGQDAEHRAASVAGRPAVGARGVIGHGRQGVVAPSSSTSCDCR